MNRVRKGFDREGASSSAAAAGYFTRALLIASYFVPLLLAAIFSVQARAATTGSEKFIPTFLIYSGGPALVADDAPRLAKFDLIDIDRFRYAEIGSNTWAAIKSLNPAVQIYLYQMGSESPSHLDSTALLNLNGLGRHDVSRGHFMGSLNGDHPELFLLNSTGSRVYNLGSSNPAANQYWYLMDFGATAYQSYWVAAVRADIVDQPWAADGVFANSCLTRASDAGYSAAPSLYPTNAAWSDAMNYFAKSITAGLFGYGQKLWCNRGGSRSVEGSAAWRALDQTASPPDVVMEEGAFAIGWGAQAVQFLPESEWKRQVDTVRAISNSKVTVASHTRLLEDQSGTDNHGKTVSYWQALWYSLGSFLLAKNDVLGNAYFMFRGGSGYDKIWWHDEYDHMDLGKAVGPYAVRKIGPVNIYWREFERGYVFVNPTASNVASVTLPQASRPLTRANMSAAPDSISTVTAIALNGHRAAILLKVASAPAPDTIAPAVPAGLTASAVSPSQVNLSWSPSSDNVGVTGYMVYLNNVALASTATTAFSHLGLAAGTTYNYSVSAFDAVPNYSARSAAIAVTTPVPPDTTPPSTPTGLTVSALTSTSFTLSWAAATDNVGVVSSRVYRDGTLIIPADTTRNAPITGLSPNTTYSFTVAAVDAAGNASPQSAPLTVTTPPPPAADTTPPSTPTGLTVSALTSTSLTLSWAAATDNVGVVSSRVYRDGTLIIPADTTRNVAINGLSPGTTYSFTVAAVDAAGNASPQSTPLTVTTPALPDTTPPSTPTGLTASAITPTSLTLTWNAATDNTGVTGYRVQNGTLVASPAGESVTLTGLSPSTQYAFTVAAVDAAGNASPQSAPVTVTTQAPPDTTAPTTPTGLTASAITPTALTLSWAAAVDTVGVTGYRVYRDGAPVVSPTGTSASINGLSASTPYAFTVAALDAAGNASPQSAPLTVTTLALPDTTPPSTPAGLTASAVTSTSFTLSWGAATDNAGVTGYRVYNGTLVASPTGTSVALTGLLPSTQYAFTVAAVDAAGNASPQSAPLTMTTPAPPDTTAPSTPTGLTASALTSTSITLSWNAATDNVGVVSSRVYRNGTLIIPADTTRNVAINGLSPSTTYSFTVVAVDAAGNASPQSAPLSVTTLASAGTACANPAGGYQGFGRNTTGGAGLTVYRVTNLNDSGAGSLRDAVSQGNRCVVFDVGGTISLSSALLVRGANITIDGFTAPSPGISLTNWGFDWHYLRGVANIIARGIRIRGTVSPEALGADGFQIVGVNNFVIDHVSIDQWGDGSIDVAGEAGVPSQNGTIQWTFFGKGRDVEDKGLLVKYGSRRISLHHNLFLNSHDRSPYCAWFDDPALTPPPNEIVCDFRNNLVLGYDWTGTSIRHRATANVVNNYFFSALAPGAGAALYIAEGGIAYASGNYSPTGANINAMANRATPFPADVPTTTDAITAGQQIVTQGGARGPNFGLDAADLNYIGQVSLP